MKGSEMEVHSEIEACRTCGIFFLTSSNLLRHLFCNDPDILMVRKELESWKMQINEDDAFPKYICTICLLEFHRIFKFQSTVIETQQQLQQLYNIQQENIQKIKIKTEIGEETKVNQIPAVSQTIPEEPNVCAFIYVDDLSDEENEYDNNESRNVTPFKVPHIPIKDEIIEEAYIPKSEEALTAESSMLALAQVNKIGEIEEIQPKEDIAAGIQCQHCLHVSEDQQQHRQHLLRIHEMKPVECHVCGKQFPSGTTETRLKYHMKWHRINKHVKCSQCGFHCPSRDVLNEHMRAVHTKIPCKICGKLLLPRKMRLHLEKHQKTEGTQKSISIDCPYCASYFSTNDERNQHISLFHINNEQLSMSSLTIEAEVVSKNVTINSVQSDSETPASSCETTSTTIASSSPNEKNQFLDNIENPAYGQVGELNENSVEDTDAYIADENFSEEYADGSADGEVEIEDSTNAVNETYEANNYEEEELEEMQFACAQCPQSFNRVEQLIAHAEVHSEKAKPFECNICGKVFDLKFSLNRHMKKHKNTTL